MALFRYALIREAADPALATASGATSPPGWQRATKLRYGWTNSGDEEALPGDGRLPWRQAVRAVNRALQ